MTVKGDGPEYQAYMKQWMIDHPGNWVQCEDCGNWVLGKKKNETKCPFHPMAKNPGERATKIRGSRDQRDWANYH